MRASTRGRIGLLALLGLPGLALAGPATLDGLRLGPRWHGFRVEPGDLHKKVVLAVWLDGGEIDRKVLQEIVALASGAADKPFHVLLFSRDGSRRSELTAALRDLGVAYGAPNLTAMGPGAGAAKEEEPAPRAVLFARSGSSAEEGAPGAGGELLAATRKLLDDTPVMELSDTPRVPDLARKVAAKQDFPATMIAIQKAIEETRGRDEELHGELFLLDSFVNGYYRERIELGKRLDAIQPSLTVPFFEALDADFKGTTQGETIASWLRSYRESKAHQAAVVLERKYLAVRQAFEEQPCCPACREKGIHLFRYDCATCVASQKSRIQATIAKLKQVLKTKHDEKEIPFLVEVRRYLDELSDLGS